MSENTAGVMAWSSTHIIWRYVRLYSKDADILRRHMHPDALANQWCVPDLSNLAARQYLPTGIAIRNTMDILQMYNGVSHRRRALALA